MIYRYVRCDHILIIGAQPQSWLPSSSVFLFTPATSAWTPLPSSPTMLHSPWACLLPAAPPSSLLLHSPSSDVPSSIDVGSESSMMTAPLHDTTNSSSSSGTVVNTASIDSLRHSVIVCDLVGQKLSLYDDVRLDGYAGDRTSVTGGARWLEGACLTTEPAPPVVATDKKTKPKKDKKAIVVEEKPTIISEACICHGRVYILQLRIWKSPRLSGTNTSFASYDAHAVLQQCITVPPLVSLSLAATKLTSPYHERRHASLIAHHGAHAIYTIGGTPLDVKHDYVTPVQRFDIRTGVWQSCAPLPHRDVGNAGMERTRHRSHIIACALPSSALRYKRYIAAIGEASSVAPPAIPPAANDDKSVSSSYIAALDDDVLDDIQAGKEEFILVLGDNGIGYSYQLPMDIYHRRRNRWYSISHEGLGLVFPPVAGITRQPFAMHVIDDQYVVVIGDENHADPSGKQQSKSLWRVSIDDIFRVVHHVTMAAANTATSPSCMWQRLDRAKFRCDHMTSLVISAE